MISQYLVIPDLGRYREIVEVNGGHIWIADACAHVGKDVPIARVGPEPKIWSRMTVKTAQNRDF